MAFEKRGFEKHRKAKDVWAIDFTADLAKMGSGITLTGTITVTASRKITGGWEDKTAELIETASPAPAFDATNKKIVFAVKAAGAGQQPAGNYGVFASAPTSDGRIAVGTASLTITDEVTG